MNAHLRRVVISAVAGSVIASLAACGGGGGEGTDGSEKGDAIKVGLLLPEDQTARYEKFDKPLIEKEVGKLTRGKGEVVYANAKQDAVAQNSQIAAMIAKKVDVLIIDAVDSKAVAGSIAKAKEAGIPVVAYDRLAEGPIDAYTSFDNEDVGQLQAKALLDALGAKADSGEIVMMNGSVTDPNAKQFKAAAHAVLDGKVTIGKEYDTVDWKPENATANMTAALSALGKGRVVGVYSANDGMAGGIVAALKAAGVTSLPPITGQDAELAGVQRIVAGEQHMSVYKRYAPEAAAAAEMAVALAKGQKIDGIINELVDSPTTKRVPSVLVPGVVLTRSNIKSTVIDDGVYTVEEICTDRLRAACAEIGLT